MKRSSFILASFIALPATLLARAKTFASSRNEKGFKVESGGTRTGEHYKMKGITSNTLDLKISGSDTDGELAVFEQIGQTPNGGPPLHIHLMQDEWFFVLEGEYIFQLGNEKFPMKPGDTIFLPRNVQHGFIQLTEKARVIVSFLPAGRIESFFKATSQWQSPPPQDVIKKLMEDHDMVITGPPLNPQ
jgi:quercetin dioxygenase-like cupin family protein